jgi:hypothetical protein
MNRLLPSTLISTGLLCSAKEQPRAEQNPSSKAILLESVPQCSEVCSIPPKQDCLILESQFLLAGAASFPYDRTRSSGGLAVRLFAELLPLQRIRLSHRTRILLPSIHLFADESIGWPSAAVTACAQIDSRPHRSRSANSLHSLVPGQPMRVRGVLLGNQTRTLIPLCGGQMCLVLCLVHHHHGFEGAFKRFGHFVFSLRWPCSTACRC